MHRTLRMALRFMMIVAALVMVSVVFTPSSQSGSPYLSALSDITATQVLAANPHCHSICEFASPGFVCGEGSKSRCVRSTSGCVTIPC